MGGRYLCKTSVVQLLLEVIHSMEDGWVLSQELAEWLGAILWINGSSSLWDWDWDWGGGGDGGLIRSAEITQAHQLGVALVQRSAS